MPSSDDTATPTSEAHDPVLLHESIAALDIAPAGCYVDATFGRGGHTRAILAALGEGGRVIALDRDPSAIAAARQIADRRLTVVHAPFSQLTRVLSELGCAQVEGALLDLGVSSPQLEQPERGFSFQHDGALDMRMDTSRGMTAAEWLANVTEQELREVIKRYGEERFAKQIARAVVAAARRERIRTTGQLAALVAAAVPTREHGQNPATRTFQAIRIYLNQELEELALALPQALALLKPGGRLVVISFHSLEDRVVKRFFHDALRPALPRRLPLRAAQLPRARLRLVGKPVRPTAAEIERNARARSAVMRVAEKLVP